MTTNRKPWYCECRVCGERWKLCTLPTNLNDDFLRRMKAAACPNCGEKKKLGMCPTDGKSAVNKSRNGKVVQ